MHQPPAWIKCIHTGSVDASTVSDACICCLGSHVLHMQIAQLENQCFQHESVGEACIVCKLHRVALQPGLLLQAEV